MLGWICTHVHKYLLLCSLENKLQFTAADIFSSNSFPSVFHNTTDDSSFLGKPNPCSANQFVVICQLKYHDKTHDNLNLQFRPSVPVPPNLCLSTVSFYTDRQTSLCYGHPWQVVAGLGCTVELVFVLLLCSRWVCCRFFLSSLAFISPKNVTQPQPGYFWRF